MSKFHEPWEHNGNAGHLPNGQCMFVVMDPQDDFPTRVARAGRIVACVNALANYDDPEHALSQARSEGAAAAREACADVLSGIRHDCGITAVHLAVEGAQEAIRKMDPDHASTIAAIEARGATAEEKEAYHDIADFLTEAIRAESESSLLEEFGALIKPLMARARRFEDNIRSRSERQEGGDADT